MNLFISPLSGFSLCTFFSDDNKVVEKISLQRSQSFADVLYENNNWKQVKNIFFISGPASFTTLRNMGVFLETLQQFSLKKYNFYSLSTGQFFKFSYPKSDIQFLSVGKRECFVFQNNNYKKYKNSELAHQLQTSSDEKNKIMGGKEYISENSQKEISSEIENKISDEKIFTEILKNKEKYYIEKIEIDYGAEPNIG